MTPQQPTRHTPSTPRLTARDRRMYRQTSDALTTIMARPGWVDAILDTTPEGTDLHARHLVWSLIIRLFKGSIERQGYRLAAQWRRERAQRGRVRLIKGRRVRSPLRARRPLRLPLTPPHAM